MKTGILSARLAVLLFVCCSLHAVQAQTEFGGNLKEVVVTATRVAQPLTDVVADVSILGRADIERMGAMSVPQILSQLPGLQAMAFGDAGRVYIRGADAYMTALYVDGVRMYSQDGYGAIGGGVPWELIPVSQIDRIEVVRGPASAIYGSDAMGGVIQIFTRKGEAGVHPFVNVGFGSYGLKKGDAGISGAQGDWDYSLSAGYQTTDGFDTRPDFVRFPNRESFSQRSSSVRLGYAIDTRHRVEAISTESTVQSQFPFYDYVTVAEIPADGSMRNTVLKWGAQWTDFYSTDLTLTRNTIAKRDTTPNDYETRFQGAVWDHQLKTGSGTLSALLEQKDESFVAQLHDAFNPAFQGSRIQEALGVGYSVQTGPHSLQINARRDHDNIFGNSQTGALGYGYALAPSWRLSAAAGSAFKAPTLEQIYSWYGDRQLKPETNENVELVLSYGHDGNAFKAVSYRNAIRNMISSSATLATCGAGSYCYFNVGQALIRGTTLSGTVHFKGFDLRASIDMLDPRNEDTGKLLSLRASETATVDVDMAVAGWSLGAEVQHVGSRYNEAANTNLLPSYDLLNLSASRSLGRDWKLLLRVDNATDQVYVQSLGYDTSYNPTPIVTPRATYFVGLQWQPRN